MKKIYFLHIPKTSGTSTYTVIDSLFPPKKVFPHGHWNLLFSNIKNIKNIRNPRSFLDKYSFIRGHFGYNPFFIKNRFTLTMLRNPITRTLSQYRHLQIDPTFNKWLPEDTIKKDETLSEFLSDPSRAFYLSNIQTKYLSSPYNPLISLPSKAEREDFYYDFQPEFHEFNLKQPYLSLAVAIFRLIKLNFFGLQEFHEESIFMLSRAIGRKIIPVSERKMVFSRESRYDEIDSSTLSLIEYVNSIDLKLYWIAKKIFFKRFLKEFNNYRHANIGYYQYISRRRDYVEGLW